MTKAAKHYGKRLDEFMSNKSTQEYIAAIQDVIPGITGITQGKRGFGGGTFCHPKLAVFFARWLDVRFAVWCDLMIDNILKGNIQTTVVVPTEEALELKATTDRLQVRVLKLEEERSNRATRGGG